MTPTRQQLTNTVLNLLNALSGMIKIIEVEDEAFYQRHIAVINNAMDCIAMAHKAMDCESEFLQ